MCVHRLGHSFGSFHPISLGLVVRWRRCRQFECVRFSRQFDNSAPLHSEKLIEGEPSLVLRSEDATASFTSEDLGARITVRLPSNLKAALEEAADDAGDSMNSFVLKTLATGTAKGRKSRRVRETLET